MAALRHPAPGADWETRGYWEGAARGELVLQRCRACGAVQHRPRALCVSCLADAIEHFVASGRGTVHTFTVTHQNQAPGFREAVPTCSPTWTSRRGRGCSRTWWARPAAVRIGMAVRVEFVATEGESPFRCPAR